MIIKYLLKLMSICLIFMPLYQSHSTEINDKIIIQSTTSTRDSGLYEYLIPYFSNKYNINVNIVAVGTGQAIINASNCDGDLLIVHSRKLENMFIANGFGHSRRNLMYNDFIVIGPKSDPSGISSSTDIKSVFDKLSKGNSKFISRGDNSGTNESELDKWNLISFDPLKYSGKWYLESGQSMGSTLNMAISLNAYTYTDRSTWLRFKNKQNHVILYKNRNELQNNYSIIKISKDNCPDINHAGANLFYDWILSTDTKALIKSYKYNNEPMFFID